MRTRVLAVRWALGVLAIVLVVPAGASAVEPPAAVEALTATASPDHVELSWMPPLSDGGAPVTSYRIWRDDVPWVEVPSSEHTFVDWRAAEGTAYTYTVLAVNAAGEGPGAAVAVRALGRPHAPQDVLAEPGPEVGDIVVTWAPPAADGGAPVRGYRIYRNDELLTAVEADVRSYLDTGLLPTEAHRYTVTAANNVGESQHSAITCSPPAPWPAVSAAAFCAVD